MYSKKYSKGVFLYLPHRRRKKSLTEQINFINSLPNVNHVEIWVEENLIPSELKFLRSSLRKYKTLIHAPWMHLSLISPHREIREITVKLYLQTLKTAEKLGAKSVTFHCGTTTKFSPERAAIELLIKNLGKIKKCYKGKVNFLIENVPEEKGVQFCYPTFLKNFVYLKSRLTWLNFTLDIGHAFRNGENLDEISKFLKKYKDSILDIHLHDATLKGLKGQDHLTLGKGNLDFHKFFQILNRVGYTGYISLETISNEDTEKSWKKIYKL